MPAHKVIVAADSATAVRHGVSAALGLGGDALRSITLLAVMPSKTVVPSLDAVLIAQMKEQSGESLRSSCVIEALRVPDDVAVVHRVTGERLDRAVAQLCRSSEYDLLVLPYPASFVALGHKLRMLRLMRDCRVATLTVPFEGEHRLPGEAIDQEDHFDAVRHR